MQILDLLSAEKMCLDPASIFTQEDVSLELVYLHLLFYSLFCPSQNPYANPGLYTKKPVGKSKYSSQCGLAYTCL